MGISRFRLAYAQQQMLDPDEVNLLNFGQGAASNAYAVRTALKQCAQVAPDLAIVEFAPGFFRTEFFSKDILESEFHVSIGPWMLDDDGRGKPNYLPMHIINKHPTLLDACL